MVVHSAERLLPCSASVRQFQQGCWPANYCACFMPWLQAFVVVGDYNGHVGLGVKCAKEVRKQAAAVAQAAACVSNRCSVVAVTSHGMGNA
jgi:hypothetical protein